jgi:hypothetical protein
VYDLAVEEDTVAVTTRTYQSTDLTTHKRREYFHDAVNGIARIRLPEGNTLVTLPEGDLVVLTELRSHMLGFLALQTAVSRERSARRPTDFGELAWAASLDDAELAEFIDELASSLAVSLADRTVSRVEETLLAWRSTAALLNDREAMALVNAPIDDDWHELGDPSDEEADPGGRG